MAEGQRQEKRVWRFKIPRRELLNALSKKVMAADLAKSYGVHRREVSRAIQVLVATDPAEFAAAVNASMLVKTPTRPLVHARIPIEPVDAAEALLSSVHGIRTIQMAFEKYITKHGDDLAFKKGHTGKIAIYLEASKVLAKVVHEIVSAQAKLSEWVGAEELRKIIVTTFDRLPRRLEALGRPVTPLEAAELAKALYLEELQGRIILLRQGRHPGLAGAKAVAGSQEGAPDGV